MSDMIFPIYIGWIYGDPDDRATLERLGVKGEMIWRASNNRNSMTGGPHTKRGIFEHCECALETLDRLEQEYPAFYRGSFTETGKKEYREHRHQFEAR